MKAVLIVLLMSTVCCMTFDQELEELWQAFKKAFNKNYGSGENRRRTAFETNYKMIVQHNMEYDQGLHSFRLTLNEYADLLNREFRRMVNGFSLKYRKTGDKFTPTGMDLPDVVDWRTKNIVTEVKKQKYCRSCWAFSATGSLEGQQALASGKLVSLSEQNLIDCSKTEGNFGCSSGDMNSAFDYIIKNGGINSEAFYPYTGQDGICQVNSTNREAIVKGYKDIASGDEVALKQAVATIGPISVAIDASHPTFQFYLDGVYDIKDYSTTNVDHGALVVGYGNDGGREYWLIKNSCGTIWGMKGYIRVARNANNMINVASYASYPVIE